MNEWVLIIDGMLLTGRNCSAPKKKKSTSSKAILPNVSPTWTNLCCHIQHLTKADLVYDNEPWNENYYRLVLKIKCQGCSDSL